MERVCPKCEYFAVLRHGHADNNNAEERYKQGDRRPYDEVIKRPSSYHDLTEEGKLQAVKTSEWFERHGLHFSHHIVSGYIRALRTASLLDLGDARWRIEERLCEKDRGILNTLTRHTSRARATSGMNTIRIDFGPSTVNFFSISMCAFAPSSSPFQTIRSSCAMAT
jgi:broad specificity phosphatase PhoE